MKDIGDDEMGCPICGKENFEVIDKLCSNMKILGESFPKSDTNVVSCNNCGLTYLNSDATQENYIAYYKSDICNPPMYYEMFGEEETEEYFQHILARLAPYIDKNSSILDVAGSWGELGAFLKRKYMESNVTIIDPKDKCIVACKEKGLKAVLGDSSNMAELLEEKYDLIILNHALEHILDIQKAMQNVKEVLKENGYVYIEIPNIEGYVKEDAAPYCFLTYEHVVHMGMDDLHNLAEYTGFTVVDSGTYYKKISSYPSIWVILKNNNGVSNKKGKHFSQDRVFLKEYIEKCKKEMRNTLKSLEMKQTKLILWGIGASTALVLEDFANCNIYQLIDNNPLRQGIEYQIGEKRYKIQAPEEVNCPDATIFILSIPYRKNIEKQIRQMKLSNPIAYF